MRFIPYLIFAVCLTGCSVKSEQPQSTVDKQTAQSAFEQYVDAINAEDIETASGFYDDGAGFHWIERGQVQYEKGANAAKSLQQLAGMGGDSNMTLNDVKVAELSDKSALISAQFDFKMVGKTDDQSFAFDGWMTVGMVKRDDGWKIAGGQTGPGPSSVEQGD